MTWIVSTPPTVEPVALAEAKDHLRAGNDDDAYITSLIVAARQHVEQICERALMPQKWRVSFDAFPEGCLEIPGGLVRAIDSVTYTDANGATQTLSSSNYQKDLDAQPARLSPLAASTWPSTQSGALNAVQVVAQVGYAKASDVPAAIRAALLLIIGDLYENRESSFVGQTYERNPAVKALLMPYKRVVP